MAKMRATAKMPRGVLQRYRTRMMTADGTFDEPSTKWSRFYAQHGWAVVVPDEPAPKRVERPERPAPSSAADPLSDKTVSELRDMAAGLGLELPSGYVKRDELLDALQGFGQMADRLDRGNSP